ncbi:MAG: hypothetical protein IKD78_13245 [Bacteroidales bacterium]|nr:hypothetical protein [Bacteroidales bacterium]
MKKLFLVAIATLITTTSLIAQEITKIGRATLKVAVATAPATMWCHSTIT